MTMQLLVVLGWLRNKLKRYSRILNDIVWRPREQRELNSYFMSRTRGAMHKAVALVSLCTAIVLFVYLYILVFTNDNTVWDADRPVPDDSEYLYDDTRRYGVVVDAGSSGSRAMLYTWDVVANRTDGATGLPVIERIGGDWTYKTTPGISSFGDFPESVGETHIKPLLDFASRRIPQAQIRRTPVHLVATAGMRLLPIHKQRKIMESACEYARAHYEFLIPECTQSFQVVSGELEGLYGWIAVNYLMDGFAHHSLGFLDMGGASAQIAFEPTAPAMTKHAHDLAKVTLRDVSGDDRQFDVFVATFLGHGTNEARRRYVESLRAHAEVNSISAVDDPCLPAGLTLPIKNPLPLDKTAKLVVLRGTGDYAKCVERTQPLLNKTAACPVEPCLFDGVHAPEIDFGIQRFVGVSEYWYASHDYLGLGGTWDVEKFESKAAQFCSTPWAQISRAHNSQNDDGGGGAAIARLQMQCFKASWLVNVLHKGFGVPRTHPDATHNAAAKSSAAPFQSINNIGNVEVSWTLGALLLRVSQSIPPSARSRASNTKPGITLPDSPTVDELIGDEPLVDDSVWSPSQFVGWAKFRVLWRLQPMHVRIVFVSAVVFTIGSVAAFGLWTVAAVRGRRDDDAVSEVGLEDVSGQQAIQRSPSMFVLEIGAPHAVAEGGGVASENGVQRAWTPLSVVAEEAQPMSRSSSIQNLPLMNRRRGNGEW